jgi:hypothetical protein
MFLIDARGEVREIYSLAFLQPQVMFNDIKTLALETSPSSSPDSGARRLSPALAARSRQ